MDMAVVIGSVVSTRMDESFQGYKLAVIQPVNEDLTPLGEPFIAVDPDSRCGMGEIVYWVGGGDACNLGDGNITPTDAAIVGIIDTVDAEKRFRTVKGGFTRFLKTDLDRSMEES